ncbi:MAG: carboxylating nicotinate-nucleotide diphosphorylase [Gammaproteobacteria bacterium]|nr:carboxylating nicotinate-nucleotide diphosphorylase [Gammaproteobacteria bacterium]
MHRTQAVFQQPVNTPVEKEINPAVHRALAEDIGSGDLTAALIPESAVAEARVISREAAILCGTAWFDAVFHELSRPVEINWRVRDGEYTTAGQTVCTLRGPARALLTGERTALNFLQTLSGIATVARRYADAVRGTGVKVLDTRKTLPGLRYAQKYAVRCGGCYNHRMGLYDGVLIKENHIRAAGSITAALRAAQDLANGALVEIEVRTLEELREALEAGAKRILLDNFTLDDLRRAVAENHGRAKLEASGGVTLENIRLIAETGVDFISVGDLTKNIKAVDLTLLFS